MAISAERAQKIDEKMNILRTRLNIPPIGKYTMPEDVRAKLTENVFDKDNVMLLVNSMMAHMRLPYERINLGIYVDRSPDRNIRYRPTGEYVFYGVPGQNQINITLTPEDTPDTVAALLSHEMSHHHLYGKGIFTQPDSENEILTDVAGVYFGFAVYMLERYADSVVRSVSFAEMMRLRDKAPAIGYIDKEQIRYAMRKCDEMRRAYRNGAR